jgi:hypothetical protein
MGHSLLFWGHLGVKSFRSSSIGVGQIQKKPCSRSGSKHIAVGHLFVTNAGTLDRELAYFLIEMRRLRSGRCPQSISLLGRHKVDIECINYRPFTSTIMFKATKELNHTVESTHLEKRTSCLNRDGRPAAAEALNKEIYAMTISSSFQTN